MEKKLFRWIGLLATVLFIAFTVSCDSGSSSDDEDIPDDVLEVAEGAFSLIGYAIGEDPGTPEPGITITQSGSTKTMTLANYSPESGVTLSGSIQITYISESPLQISIMGNATISGSISAVIAIEATASWSAGTGPEHDPPASMSGSFVYNGKSYNILSILEALEDFDDDDIEPEDAPPPSDDVLETAEGIFSLVGLMIEDSVDYPPEIVVVEMGDTTQMSLANYEPESGLFVSGSINVMVTATTPYAISIYASITMSGEFDATVTMTANASWETGSPGEDPPSAIHGSFTFNGVEYSVAELLAALD